VVSLMRQYLAVCAGICCILFQKHLR
jgi:hypothetical protein